MYELHKWLDSINEAAQRSFPSTNPIQLTSSADQSLAGKRRESAHIDDAELLAAAERLGVPPPPLQRSEQFPKSTPGPSYKSILFSMPPVHAPDRTQRMIDSLKSAARDKLARQHK
jgi:hypothetical protein